MVIKEVNLGTSLGHLMNAEKASKATRWMANQVKIFIAGVALIFIVVLGQIMVRLIFYPSGYTSHNNHP
jgi:hypothetical protein